MSGRTAADVSTDRNAEHSWAAKISSASVVEHRKLISYLINAGPDVVTELDLGYWLKTPCCHSDRDSGDGTLGERRVKNPGGPVFSG